MKIFTIDEIKMFDENLFKILLDMDVREDNARNTIFKVNASYLKNMNKSEFIDYITELSFNGIMLGIAGTTIETALSKAFRSTPAIYNEYKDELEEDTTSASDSNLRV